MDELKTREFQRISKMKIKELLEMPLFKANQKEIRAIAMGMATGEIPG
jgi:DNA topoisomerase VI subunit B